MLSNLNTKVKLCARQFRSEVNPDTAADILFLADRHSLAELKQVETNTDQALWNSIKNMFHNFFSQF